MIISSQKTSDEGRYKAIYEESFGRLNLSIIYSSEQGKMDNIDDYVLDMNYYSAKQWIRNTYSSQI